MKLIVRKKEMPPLFTRMAIVPESLNEENRTFDVTFGTDTPVLRSGWDGKFLEVLSFKDGAVRLDRLNAGAPVLDNHNSYGSVRTSNLGVVTRAWIEKGKGAATLKLSRSEDKVWNDIKDGITNNVSVGYRVYEFRVKEADKDSIATYTAVDWEPYEISMTTIPADYNSTVRSAENGNLNYEVNKVKLKSDMKKVIHRIADVEAGGGDPKVKETPKAEPVTTRTEAEIMADGVKAEKTRSEEIMKAVRTAKLPIEFAEKLVKGNITIDNARAAIIDEWAKASSDAPTQGANGNITITADERDKKRSAMEDAILLRAGILNYNKDFKAAPGATDFRGMTLLDMCRETLDDMGAKTRGLSQREIATGALGLNTGLQARTSTGALGTSDFPFILANTVNRTLRQMYDLAPRTFMPFCKQTTAKDFRPVNRTQITNLADLLAEIPENGEYTATSMGDLNESYSLKKYGRKITISWEALVNDDLDAFARTPQAIANAAAQTQSNLVWAIMTGNPNLSDGFALFSTQHHNIAGTPAILSLTSLDLARQSFRNQTDPKGNLLNLSPDYLIVGPGQEQLALQFMSTNYVATKSGDINTFQGSMQIIVEPRITGNKWFLAAKPSKIDTIEYAFLEGEGELFTEQRIGFDVDGIEIKARMVFATKAIESRGLFYNAGV